MIPLYDGEKLYVRLEHPVLQEGHAHPNRMDGGPRMRLPNTAHTSRPWRIHELTRDFRLEDVWELPTPGDRDDFPRLVELMASLDPSSSSRAVGALMAIRLKLGEVFGLDDTDAG